MLVLQPRVELGAVGVMLVRVVACDRGRPSGRATRRSHQFEATARLAALPSTTAIQAIAVASGFTESGVASGVYTITPPAQVSTPSFTPAPGTYESPQQVTLNCATAGATVHCTLDGSDPTTSSTSYVGPITVSSTTTIQAIAVASGFTESGIASGVYRIVTSCASAYQYYPGCSVGEACHPGWEDAYCGPLGGACLACPAECYCYGLCWYRDTGDPCPAPYAK